jgi:hypothetical protein
MAKDLSSAPGIGSGPGFLNGNIQDNLTLIGEYINQDPIQFFQKLMDIAGLTANDDYDNETNGYQLIEALYKSITAGLKTKTISLGAWNMYSSDAGSATRDVAHGLGSNWVNIRTVNVVVFEDAGGANHYFPKINPSTGASEGWVDEVDSTNIKLVAPTSGYFDNANFNGLSDRGYVTIQYLDTSIWT